MALAHGQLRLAGLVVASWFVVAAVSGYAVFKIVQPARSGPEDVAGPGNPDDRLPRDPVARDAEAMLTERAANLGHNSEGWAAVIDQILGDQVSDPAALPANPVSSSEVKKESKEERLARYRAAQRAAFQSILSGSSPWSRLDPPMLDVLQQEDIAAGLAQVEQMEWSPESNRLLQGLLRRWAQLDPAAAAAYALQLESNRAGSQAVRSIWSEWSRRDPAAAVDWYFAHLREQPARLGATLREAFTELARLDMARALTTAWQLPEAQGREALKAIVRQASLEGGLEALEPVIAGMSPGYQRSQMIQAIVQEYAIYEPQLAVQWINRIDDPGVRGNAVAQFVDTWAFDRPADAAQWIMGLGDEALRARSAAAVIQHWSLSDPEAAGQWLMQVPPARPMDGVVERHIRMNLEENPAYAAGFLSRITDARRRDSLAVTIGRSWIRRNPAEAEVFLQQSGWSAGVLSRIRKT